MKDETISSDHTTDVDCTIQFLTHIEASASPKVKERPLLWVSLFFFSQEFYYTVSNEASAKKTARQATGAHLISTLYCAPGRLCGAGTRLDTRHSALAWYGTQITGSSVDTAFDSSFTDFNQQLKANGVKLAQVPTETVNLPCSTSSYHHFRVTVQCIKSRVVYASPSVPDKAIANWPGLYKTLTTHMTGGVSNVASISNVAPSTLFVYQPKPTGFPENDVRLVGQEGKVACSIDMIADAPHAVTTRVTASSSISTMRPAGLLMTEHCERDVNFFGGWGYCSNHPCKPDWQ